MKLSEASAIEEAKRAKCAPTLEQMAAILEAHKSENPELEEVKDEDDDDDEEED